VVGAVVAAVLTAIGAAAVLISGSSSTPQATPPQDTKQIAPSEKQPEPSLPGKTDKTTKPKPPPPDPG